MDNAFTICANEQTVAAQMRHGLPLATDCIFVLSKSACLFTKTGMGDDKWIIMN